PEVVVRNAVQRAAGGYDAGCRHGSDLNMWLRIAAHSDVAYVRGAPQAIYRVHAASMLRTKGGALTDLRERKAAFDSFFASCAPQLDGAEQLQRMVGRKLARQAMWRASRAVDRGAGAEDVEELVAFGLDAYPGARRLREWHGEMQAAHNFSDALAVRHPVLYVDPPVSPLTPVRYGVRRETWPRLRAVLNRRVRTCGRLKVFTPLVLPPIEHPRARELSLPLLRAQVRHAVKRAGMERPVVLGWRGLPELAGVAGERLRVGGVMD